MRFSQQEVEDLLVSWIVLSVAFAVFMKGLRLFKNPFIIPQMLVIVGTAFVLHELSHKYVAQRYNLWAEYRKFTWGLLLAIFLSLLALFPSGVRIFFGFPGAVMIMGTAWMSPEIEARVSVAGPVSNIIVGIVALLTRSAVGNVGYSGTVDFLTSLAAINLYLAMFNMIPFPPFDGSKVVKYSPVLWIGTAALIVILLFVVV